ncbi:MAG: glycosyltransferase family 4 protein [Chloroflexota bacterium]
MVQSRAERGLTPPVVYDVTRLVTRGLNSAPNGIDRIDFLLARHFLENGATPLACTALGPRLADSGAALATMDAIESCWRENADATADAVYRSVVDRIRGRGDASRIKSGSGVARVLRNGRALRHWGFRLGRSPGDAPPGSVYLNATQFLLDRPWYVRWLASRPDVKPVAFVHDLLPLDHPEFFQPREAALHPRRNRNICRLAAGVVVASQTVARRFEAYADENGRKDLPICVARPPVTPVFTQRIDAPEELAGVDYFIACGTIEPRKNHLLLLNVWRELAANGPAPKLVLVGKRGWLNQNVVDMLSRCPALRGNVIEAGALSTPGLRRLMAGARALLMPSFGEGFGLPVAEALAAGLPVIASDLDVFREIAGAAPEYLHPLDGPGWSQAVRDYISQESSRRAAAMARMEAGEFVTSPQAFLATVESFLTSLRGA